MVFPTIVVTTAASEAALMEVVVYYVASMVCPDTYREMRFQKFVVKIIVQTKICSEDYQFLDPFMT